MTARRIPLAAAAEAALELGALLARGGVIAIPTESSYGLAADATSAAGVAAIYRLKRREAGKPLPVLAADEEQLATLGVDLSSPACALGRALWPAAVSVVLPIARPVAASAGSLTVAARIPAAPPGLRPLLARLGSAVTATSANESGAPPLLAPAAVAAFLGAEDAIVVDGGPLAGGPPSTLVAFDGRKLEILRPGRAASETIAAIADGLRLAAEVQRA